MSPEPRTDAGRKLWSEFRRVNEEAGDHGPVSTFARRMVETFVPQIEAQVAATPTLDDAWREALDLLPDGWDLAVYLEGGEYLARAGAHRFEWPVRVLRCDGSTPAEALTALASALRDRS